MGRASDILRVERTLAQARVDMLVVHTSHDWSTVVRDLLLLLATRRRRPRTVLQLHGSRPEILLSPGNALFKHASRLLLRMSDAVLVLSSQERVQWRQFHPKGKFYRVSNPFTHDATPPAALHEALSRVVGQLNPGVPCLLFVGRLIREKGILDILHALATIRDATPARLLVAGDGPLAPEVGTLARSLNLEDRVRMLGYLQGEALEAVYAMSTAFVLPTWWIEGFPTVIAEAMHAGLPIVTTSIRGMADHLEQETNALFVPPRDPAALAGALLRLVTDRGLCTAMGVANREAVKKFSPERVGQEYLAVLESVAEEGVITTGT